jgi:hypothetical protein
VSVPLPAPNETSTPKVAQAARALAAGHTNSGGSFVLALGATSTVINSDACGPDSLVHFSPTSEAAAAAGAWKSATAIGSFTIAHPAAAAGCTFDYEVRNP